MFIWKLPDWPNWRYDLKQLAQPLATIRHQQGRLIGRMASLGFKLRAEALLKTLTQDVLKTSEQGAAALGKHLALPCAQCHGVLRRILSRDRPAAGIRHNDATLKSLPRYRGLLAIALLSLARRSKAKG